MSGAHEYVRLAREFEGKRSAYALPLPGFVGDEPLPSDREALAQIQAKAIGRLGLDGDFVLAGHSSGGWVAHSLASHLASIGMPPASLILLDTYSPRADALDRILPAVMAAIADAAKSGMGIDDRRLTAMGAYGRIFSGWEPAELACPTLMIRASDQVGQMPDGIADDWRAAWALSNSVADVPGDHFSMMLDHAKSTAAAVENALVNGPKDYTHGGS